MHKNRHKEYFILEDGLTYLNCANMSPLLREVREAGVHALDKRAAPWKLGSEDWFGEVDVLRQKAVIIFGTSGENIAIVPSASYGLAIAARNLSFQTGDEILI